MNRTVGGIAILQARRKRKILAKIKGNPRLLFSLGEIQLIAGLKLLLRLRNSDLEILRPIGHCCWIPESRCLECNSLAACIFPLRLPPSSVSLGWYKNGGATKAQSHD